jgi:prepilin-type N-terminal cleavage/methylation domain-containing protein
MHKVSVYFSSSLTRSFTLVELIIVVIIVGILASLGLTQYSTVVEKSRQAEAKVRLGVMRSLTYEYYLNGGDLTSLTNADLGVDSACHSTDFFKYLLGTQTSTYVNLHAWRCTSGGKAPNYDREYRFFMRYYPSTGSSTWHCYYSDDSSPCFGLPG